MKKLFLAALVTTSMLFLGGCGSNDFDIPGHDSNTSVDQNGTGTGSGSSNTAKKYRFMNASPVVATAGSQTRTLTVQLVDELGIGVAEKDVMIQSLPMKYGFITPAKAKTDASGTATFTYRSPRDISQLAGQSQPVYFVYKNDEHSTPLLASASILFDNTAINVDQNLTLPTVVIPTSKKSIELSSNSQSTEISIQVYKDGSPYTAGAVKVALPPKVFAGVDVGQFLSYEVTPNAQGIAVFHYTGPSNLKALLDNDDNGSNFGFYHTENSTAKQEMFVTYRVPANQNVTLNYFLNLTTDGEYSMGIPNHQKQFTITLKAKDGSGNDVALSTESISKLVVETTNGTIAQILDNNVLKDQKSLPIANGGGSFTLQSKKLSGLVPLKITMEFTDVNGKSHGPGGEYPALTTIVNVRVFSGPPSAISISYVGTSKDVARAKYIETLAISVTDEYGNKVNTHPNISVGAVAGYTVDGREAQNRETNETKRLFYGRNDVNSGRSNGEIAAPDASHKTSFQDGTAARSDVFKYANAEGANTDKLVVFGERKNYEAMGKWDIKALGANNVIELEDDYYGVHRDGLYYAVGHNYYQDQCLQDGREWIGSTDANGSYQIDDEGTVTVQYVYDHHLGGKDVLIWVNLDGIQPDTGKKTRIGEVLKHTLRTAGLTHEPSAGYSLPKGAHAFGTFVIWHENTSKRYRNAHFGYAIKSGSTCAYDVVANSNWFDARTCSNKITISRDDDNNASTPNKDYTFGSNDGTSYVTFELWAPVDKACSFDIVRTMVSREF